MPRLLATAIVGIALLGAVGPAAAGGDYVVVVPSPAFYMGPCAWPCQNLVNAPRLIGRHAPRIAMPPSRFYAYPYVSSFAGCVRGRRVASIYGWRPRQIRVCD